MTDRTPAEVSPEMIAAAWSAWHARHGGKLGPGPAFVEAIKAAIAASPPAPAAEPTAGLVLRLSVHRMMGMYGAAYDGPKDARAYTSKHQPSNQHAWKMGKAACAAAKEPGGDYIDGGLALLRHLEAEGFGVFALVKDEPLEPHPIDAAAIRAEARKAALEEMLAAIHAHLPSIPVALGDALRALADKGEAE